MRYGISASVSDKERGKDATYFTVVTHQRQFNFKADSVASAKDWVKALRKIIFRSHNEGDSIKISLPIHNIIDVEDSQIIEFADTCKIRVIDNDETFAIDEVSNIQHNIFSIAIIDSLRLVFLFLLQLWR